MSYTDDEFSQIALEDIRIGDLIWDYTIKRPWTVIGLRPSTDHGIQILTELDDGVHKESLWNDYGSNNKHKITAKSTAPLPNETILEARLKLKELSNERNRNWKDQQVQYFSSRWLCTR